MSASLQTGTSGGNRICGRKHSKTWTPESAYENCKQLVKVDISLTTLKILNMHTFSHCVSLIDICLPPTLQEIQAEAFKGCLALASIDLPDKLRYIAHKAFGDCGQLLHLRYRRDVRVTWRRPYAESNAFESCFRLDLPWWLNYLPPNGDDWTVPPSYLTVLPCTS